MMRKDFFKLVHREGYTPIIVAVATTFILASFSSTWGWLSFIITILCVVFFRNPDRWTPVDDNLIISPADGIVQNIEFASPPKELGLGDEEMLKVSIFLNVFNVHVNRIPASGKILALHYRPGRFFNASLDKASIYNERQSVLMETANGTKVIFVQIAGLIARRIICDLEEGSEVLAGERYGIIKFGSRVDLYLPQTIIPLVHTGQTLVGGETIMANLVEVKNEKLKFEVR